MRFPGYDYLCLTIQDVDHSIKGRGMFAQSLILIKGEYCYCPRRFLYDFLADNRTILIGKYL
jgi:hypothetical protein